MPGRWSRRMATRSTMPLDSAPAGPAKATNCHRFAGFVPARFPLDGKRIAQRVIVVAQRAVLAARPDGVIGKPIVTDYATLLWLVQALVREARGVEEDCP